MISKRAAKKSTSAYSQGLLGALKKASTKHPAFVRRRMVRARTLSPPKEVMRAVDAAAIKFETLGKRAPAGKTVSAAKLGHVQGETKLKERRETAAGSTATTPPLQSDANALLDELLNEAALLRPWERSASLPAPEPAPRLTFLAPEIYEKNSIRNRVEMTKKRQEEIKRRNQDFSGNGSLEEWFRANPMYKRCLRFYTKCRFMSHSDDGRSLGSISANSLFEFGPAGAIDNPVKDSEQEKQEEEEVKPPPVKAAPLRASIVLNNTVDVI